MNQVMKTLKLIRFGFPIWCSKPLKRISERKREVVMFQFYTAFVLNLANQKGVEIPINFEYL